MRDAGSMLASGFVLGAALVLAVTAAPRVSELETPGPCPVGQSLQGDTAPEGYDWFYCEPLYEPCESEDSAGPCFWDAAARGNEVGESFTVSPDQTVTYWN